MKRSNIIYFLIVGFGFLFFILGGFMLMGGAYIENNTLLYMGISSILIGVAFYVVLAIVLLIKYLKGRKKK